MPVSFLLISAGQGDDSCVGMWRAADQETDRKTRTREAAGDRDRGQAADAKRECAGVQSKRICRVLDLERQAGQGRNHDEVDVAESCGDVVPVSREFAFEFVISRGRYLFSLWI